MMPDKKNYSYSNLADTPQHGEITESSYILGEKGPKSTWTRITEVVILLATIGGCAYLMVFLFHSGNHHSADKTDSGIPTRPVGASSSTMNEGALCVNNPVCMAAGLDNLCCPTAEGVFLECCPKH